MLNSLRKKNHSIVIIQARTSSERLPGKILLPIQGYPIILLAIRRASNTGREVIVATSKDKSDDKLVRLLEKEKIPYFRGSLKNVLSRYANIVKSRKEKLVFRLTTDNVFPDGRLLDEMEKFFLKKNLEYLTCGKDCGLPYGVSVELTKTKHIIEANKKKTTNFEKEHVTPCIRKKFKVTYFKKYKNLTMSHYRCTIDNYDDYNLIRDVFKNLKNQSIKISLKKLILKLKKTQKKFLHKDINKKIILGCAQFGSKYGINNQIGRPSISEIKDILKFSYENKIKYLDTARDYESSEKTIGQIFFKNKSFKKINVITKLSALKLLKKNSTDSKVNTAVLKSINESLKNLKQKKIHTLLLHRSSHLFLWKGEVLNILKKLKEKKIIQNLGVSVQTPYELSKVLKMKEINCVQLPYNIFDHRWDKHINEIKKIRKKYKLRIYARSVLLQGLINSNNFNNWKKANLSNEKFQKVIKWLNSSVKKLKRANILDLCLSFVNSINWIDGIVIGTETSKQIEENLFTINRTKLSDKEIKIIRKTRPKLKNVSLNPALWKK